MANYSINKKVSLPFAEAVEKTREVLKEQGFGILTEIDVKKTLQEKLGVDYKNYIILGACNPPRAYKALTLEEEIGLLLPCNVIVYESDDGVVVAAVDPEVAFTVSDNDSLRPLAAEVKQMLTEALNNL